MNSKEYLQECLNIEDSWFNEFPLIDVPNAVDEFAKVEAIGFAEYLKETNWCEKETWGKHDPPSIPTTEQLYELYLESKKQ